MKNLLQNLKERTVALCLLGSSVWISYIFLRNISTKMQSHSPHSTHEADRSQQNKAISEGPPTIVRKPSGQSSPEDLRTQLASIESTYDGETLSAKLSDFVAFVLLKAEFDTALSIIDEISVTEIRKQGLRLLGQRMGQGDIPPSAHLTQLLANADYTDFSIAYTHAKASSNPDDMFRILQKVGAPSQATAACIRQWAKINPSAALAAAKESGILNESKVLANLAEGFVAAGQGKDFWLLQTNAHPISENLSKEVFSRWANSKPRDLAANISKLTFQNERQRQLAFHQLAFTWAARQPKELSSWLSTLPQGKDRDVAISAMATRIGDSNPDEVIPWVNTISDEKLKSAQLRFIQMNRQ